MKKLVEVEDGLEALMGERVTFFCINYIYTGKLSGVNDKYIMLEDAGIVYETGSFAEKEWKDYQPLQHPIFVMLSAIESFAVMK
ncbi:hypothetical protein LCGC14_2485330 [marine sediment metagenome]|uniref:Uncharacterized protein n=1 Tax=marine sediment metagenome TaxID=412755 RepID=A0A0F9E009_9ZZZZ